MFRRGGSAGRAVAQLLYMKTTNLLHKGFLLTFIAVPLCSGGDLRVEISRLDTSVLLTWTNSGAVLETSLTVPGDWNVVAGASSPYLVPPTNVSSFYRLRQAGGGSFDVRYLAPTFTTGIGDPSGGCGCTSPENPNSLSAAGNPQDNGLGSVFLHTGELTQHVVDLAIPGRGFDWRLERRYRSGMAYDGPLGHGWDFNYNQRLAVQVNGDVLRVDGMGRVDRYVFADGSYLSPSGFYTRLVRNPDGSFDERDRHGMVDSYSVTNGLGLARLARIRDRNGNQMTFDYNALGQLTNVVDTLGRSIAYGYDGNGRLTKVTDFTGRMVQFSHDADGNLSSVTSPAVTGTPNGNDFPLGKTTRYTYSSGFGDARFNHNLLTVTAPNEVAVSGPPRLVAEYDTNPASTNADRVVSLFVGGTNATGVGAGGTLRYAYAGLGSAPPEDFSTATAQTTVTNRNGNVAEYRFNQLGNPVRQIQFTRELRPGEPVGFTNQFEYNRDGETTRRVLAEGGSTEYTYDSANADRLQQGNLLQVRRWPGPRGGDQAQLVTSMTYETNCNFVATSTDGRANTTAYAYDEHGNRTNTLHRIPGISERWEYNTFGQQTAHVLPDNGSGSRRRDEMTYYSSGPQTGYLQSQAVDSGGLNLTTTYEYDAVGNVTRVVDPRGQDTLYIVNALNQVVRTLLALLNTSNGSVRYQRDLFYDANERLTRVDLENRDDTGALVSANPALTTTYTYDILGNRLSTTQEVDASASVVTTYAFDPNQNLLLTRFGEATAGRQTNNVVQKAYDERDLEFREIRVPGSGDQSTTQHDYDANGNLVRIFQGLEDLAVPRVTVYAYDGYDRRTTATDAMGNVITHHYDANGNLVTLRVEGELADGPGSAANVRLSETTYIFDAMDRRVRADTAFFDTQTQAPLGDGLVSTTTLYSDHSQVLATIDDNNHGRTNRYDTVNRLAQVTDPKGNTVSYAYDANGNTLTTVEVDKSDLGNPDVTVTTRFTYDGLNRRTEVVDNLNQTNRVAYDSRSHPTLRVDARGNRTHSTYDGLDRRLSTERVMTSTGDGSGAVVGSIITRQAWDDSSRLITQTDNNTNTTRYSYDGLNRCILSLFADGTGRTNHYDMHGDRTSSRDANGSLAEMTYDLLGRLLTNRVTRGPGIVGTTNEVYQYDGCSRIIQARDDDTVVTRSYDSRSRVTRETQQVLPSSAVTVTASYDGVGNPTRLVYPGGRALVRTYDGLNLPTLIRDDPPAPDSTIAIFSYLGRRTERRDYGNGLRLEVNFDALRRPVRTAHLPTAGGPSFDERLYAWDSAQNQAAVQVVSTFPPEQHFFQYDSARRLVSSQAVPSGISAQYSLDGVGNRVSVAAAPPEGGVYTMNPSLPEPADRQMNQYTTTPFDTRQSDRNGNLIVSRSGTLLLSYDYRNQLAQASDTALGLNTLYRYDCFGRRVEKAVNGVLTRYRYCGAQEIEEQTALNVTAATYVWGGASGVLGMTRGGRAYFYHADDLNTRRKVTDAAGSVVEQYDYSDFGKPSFFDAVGHVLAASAIANPWLFTGHRYDAETGLSFCRARYLDSRAGRFLTRDPIGAWGDAGNLGNPYTYAHANPTSRIDPSGLTARGCGDDPASFSCEDIVDTLLDINARADYTSRTKPDDYYGGWFSSGTKGSYWDPCKTKWTEAYLKKCRPGAGPLTESTALGAAKGFVRGLKTGAQVLACDLTLQVPDTELQQRSEFWWAHVPASIASAALVALQIALLAGPATVAAAAGETTVLAGGETTVTMAAVGDTTVIAGGDTVILGESVVDMTLKARFAAAYEWIMAEIAARGEMPIRGLWSFAWLLAEAEVRFHLPPGSLAL